ncbi:hypothetical protein ASA1KI_13340 [Opitutales bacterium ASA1]|uniref:hypothetical protein n=1 Tax=Congregicoccus parvus TaxID=3081749 RepID=UPI002B2D2A4F|nr:hypothetical protein ASA1KI_13340 [Opitutales bacterium ASA1]
MKPHQRLARLHCVNALLHALTGSDLYLASQVLEAVEAAEAEARRDGNEDLGSRLARLHETLLGTAPDVGFAFCDAEAGSNAGPLFLRAEVLAAVRRNAPRGRATIMVGGLPGSETTPNSAPRGRRSRAMRALAREHAELVAHLRDLVARRANPRSLLTLLFV